MSGQGSKPLPIPATRCMSAFERRVQVPGYSSVEASAIYMQLASILKLQVIFYTSPLNKGPNLLETKVVKWYRVQNVAGMRKALEEYVGELEKSLANKSYPARTYLFERCNPSGDPEFLEKVCATCVCPHCEIATVP